MVAFFFACVGVSFVVLFTQSFRMLSFVVNNSGSLGVFFQLMGLMIPTFLPLILPISFGIAVLFIYHKVAVDSELVIMRSAGLDSLKLAGPALVLAVVLILAGGMLTLWVTPAANRALVALQYKVKDSYSAAMIRPGAFNDLADGLTLFAEKRSGGKLENILVHDVRRPETPVTIMAKNGQFLIEKGIPQIFVFNGRRQMVEVKTGRLQELAFDRYTLDLRSMKGEKSQRRQDPREVSLSDLLNKSGDPSLSEKDRGRVRAELNQRLAGPLLSMTFAIIGVTVILVGNFNRRGMTRRVLFAAVAMVLIQAAMIGLVSQTGRSVWFIPILYTVTLMPVPVCMYLLTREEIDPLSLLWGRRTA